MPPVTGLPVEPGIPVVPPTAVLVPVVPDLPVVPPNGLQVPVVPDIPAVPPTVPDLPVPPPPDPATRRDEPRIAQPGTTRPRLTTRTAIGGAITAVVVGGTIAAVTLTSSGRPDLTDLLLQTTTTVPFTPTTTSPPATSTTSPGATGTPSTTTTTANTGATSTTAAGTGAAGAVVSFVSSFTAALQNGNASFLYSTLDPRVIARYGAATCQQAVTSLSPSAIAMTVRSVSGPATWTWAADGQSLQVPDVYTVNVVQTANGRTNPQILHLSGPTANLHWFTDCRTDVTNSSTTTTAPPSGAPTTTSSLPTG